MIESVYIFPHPWYMTVVFDEKGRQIPMLQGPLIKVIDKLAPAILRCKPKVWDGDSILKDVSFEPYFKSLSHTRKI